MAEVCDFEGWQKTFPTCTGNKSVVTKLSERLKVSYSAPHHSKRKKGNRLLNEKTKLINRLDDQVIAVRKVEDIEKEIEDATSPMEPNRSPYKPTVKTAAAPGPQCLTKLSLH